MFHFFGPKDKWHGLFVLSAEVLEVNFTVHLLMRQPWLWGYHEYEDYKSFDAGPLFSVCWG